MGFEFTFYLTNTYSEGKVVLMKSTHLHSFARSLIKYTL